MAGDLNEAKVMGRDGSSVRVCWKRCLKYGAALACLVGFRFGFRFGLGFGFEFGFEFGFGFGLGLGFGLGFGLGREQALRAPLRPVC